MALLGSVLDTLGLGRERVALKWISASEGRKFARTVDAFVQQMKSLGPSPMSRNV